MSKLTLEKAGVIAEYLVKKEYSQLVLKEDGTLNAFRGRDFIVAHRFNVSNKTNKKGVLWQQSLDSLIALDPKLKYKTHLTKYLYKTLTIIIEKVKNEGLTGNPEIDAILTSEKYQTYLKNELINLTCYINEKDTIVITSETSGFAYHERKKRYTKEELLDLHEKARMLAISDDRAKVKKPYKYKNLIERSYDEYEDAYNKYEQDFDALRKLWAWKIEGDGLHYGLNADDIYKKIILPVEYRLTKMDYNNNVLRSMRRMVASLESTVENASDKDNGLVSYTVVL